MYQREATSACLNSPARMVRAGYSAREIMIAKISVTSLGGYARNLGYKTSTITYEFESRTFNYNRDVRLFVTPV